ncbi:MAG: hypothetical protein IKC68_06245 [Bacteroidales bacterium]|nr:hypothetical protein [Bacteroidales bacterium]MBR2856816.1 hypothetical protein [Bacteroidales bacterium]
MKYINILFAALAAAMMFACHPDEEIIFGVEVGTEDGNIAIGPEGGLVTINVSAQDEWTAVTEDPWIMVSPANGRGSQKCVVSIDSTIVNVARQGAIRIQNLTTGDKKDFAVAQEGFEYQIALKEDTKELADFAAYESRSFDVEVLTNVDFEVMLPKEAENWLSYKKSELVLDRGARPRKVNLHFDWNVNSRPEERVAKVELKPVEAVKMGRHDTLNVVQKAAMPIPAGTPAGDSLAVLAISRALGCYTEWDTAEKLEHWSNVQVHKDGPDKGRVKYVQFFIFNTKEPLPYEVQYLTAAEEIAFYSNANQFLKSLDTGEYITKLTQLKRLTIGAYGLTSLHPDFKNLKNLEYLDLSSNCFQTIPEILTKENFPNLHSLILNANQRYTVYDLSNDTRENIGGFIEDTGLRRFKDILKWDKLDTLRLSVNYLQGDIPDMKYEGLPTWTYEELKDSLAVGTTALPEKLVGLPKVLPNAKFFAINFNRFTGTIPDWILYHPNLDLWIPYSLIFSQEGKTKEGKNAGFANEPTSLDYYYEIYANKKYNPNKKD